MSNIIDKIQVSGITYQIEGDVTVDAALDSGSTNPVANSAITTALDNKVNVVDNNVSAYTFENKIGGAIYEYSEHFAGPIYIRYTGSTSSSGDYYAGSMLYYSSEWGWDNIGLSFNLSNGQITATTVSSAYFDIEIENGEATLTFKDGFYLRQYNYQNGFVALTKTAYESGQSADVIEDTVYDVFDKLNDKIDERSDNAITGGSIYFSNGYLDLNLHSKKTDSSSSVKIDSSTIKSSNNGLSVQFETPEVADKILNVGSGTYGQLFSINSYDTSLNEFTITFNPNYTQSNVYHFQVRIKDASNVSYSVTFEYDSADMSAEYTNLSTYCTVTDTLSTDYKLKVTAKEGYKISRLYNNEYMVGGVDNTTPNNYISNLVTTPSYVLDGQDVIDDIYDKLDGKVDVSAFTAYSGAVDTTINSKASQASVDALNGVVTAHTANTDVHVTSAEKATWNAKSDFSGSYNDLTDKPTIPSKTSDLTNDSNFATSAYVDTKLSISDFNTYSGTVNTAIDNKANSSDVYTKSQTSGATEIATALSGKQDTLSAGTNITIVDNVISATGGGGGGMTEDDELLLATALTDLNDRKIDASEVESKYQRKGDYATKNYVTTALEPYETKLDEINTEEVTAYALNDLNNRFGGLRIVKITESEYEALTTKDENTLYIVVADQS